MYITVLRMSYLMSSTYYVTQYFDLSKAPPVKPFFAILVIICAPSINTSKGCSINVDNPYYVLC